jgi:hypothetical protein
MVLTVLKGLGKAYLKGKKGLGGKTSAEWKALASAAKLKAAQFNLKESFRKVDKTFDKLEKTLRKQKKILDD